MSAEVVEGLRRARALIAAEPHWLQGDMARDADGNLLNDPRDPRACAWCLVGAVLAVVPDIAAAMPLVNALLVRLYGRGDFQDPRLAVPLLTRWNDDREHHAEVLVLLDLAIAAEKARQ